MSEKKRAYLLILLIVILAAFLRLPHLDRSLWGDEVDSVFTSHDLASDNFTFHRHGIGETLAYPVAASFKDGSKMPLYFEVLGGWINLFGPSSFAVRALSVFFGLATVVVLFFFASKYFGDGVAVLGALLLAASPEHILYSHDVRPYSLMALLAIPSVWCFMKLITGDTSKRNYILYFISSVLLTYTHYHAILFFAAQFIIAAYYFMKEKFAGKYANILLCQILVFAVFASWAFFGIFRLSNVLLNPAASLPFPTYNFVLRGGWTALSLLFGESIAPWNPIIALGAVVALAIFIKLCILMRKTKDIPLTIIAALVAISLTASLFIKATLPNYMITVLPFLAVLEAYAVMKFTSLPMRVLIVALLLSVNCVSIGNYYNLREMHNSNRIEPWRKISSDIIAGHRQGDVIYTGNYFVTGRELQYYINVIAGRKFGIRLVSEGIKGERGVFVYSIHDENEKEAIFGQFRRSGYRMISQKNYVPYGETLASRLPWKHHKLDQARVEVYTFENQFKRR